MIEIPSRAEMPERRIRDNWLLKEESSGLESGFNCGDLFMIIPSINAGYCIDPQIDRKTVNAGLIRVFHSVFAAVSDIFGYGFGTVVGGQSRIHEYPVFAVKFDNIVHPS